MSFAIVTDTAANIPANLMQEHNITAVPLSYFLNGEEHICRDSATFDCAGYYNAIRNGMVVTTSQVNPQKYIETFGPLLKDGLDILFVGLSSGVSGSFASGLTAASELQEQYPDRKIRMIDSKGASMGEGLLVLRAADCRKDGMDVDQAADYIERLIPRIGQVFTVGDLMHLRRTGRLSNVSAVVGTVLNIKPLLKGNEQGKIVSCGKVRGRKKVIEEMAARYDKWVQSPENQVVSISHTDCIEDVNTLISLIQKNHPPKKIIVVNHEPVTGSHLGPDSLALFFEGREGVRGM